MPETDILTVEQRLRAEYQQILSGSIGMSFSRKFITVSDTMLCIEVLLDPLNEAKMKALLRLLTRAGSLLFTETVMLDYIRLVREMLCTYRSIPGMLKHLNTVRVSK